MADVTPTDGGGRNVYDSRERYEKQKQELKEKYEEQLTSLRENYEHKVHEEQLSGEAAVNHIRHQSDYKAKVAEQDAAERQKSVDAKMATDSENLRKRQASSEAYLDQAKKHHAAWVQGQNENLENEKKRVVDQERDQLDHIRETEKKRVLEAQKHVNQESSDIREKGDQNLRDLKNDYRRRISAVDQEESKHLSDTRTAHTREIEGEKRAYRDEITKENQAHAQAVSSLRQAHSEEAVKIREKSNTDVKHAKESSDRRLHETVAQGDSEVKQQRDRHRQEEQDLRDKHQQEVTHLDQQQKQELLALREKFKHDKNYEQSQYDRDLKVMHERHEDQRQKQLQRQDKELEDLKQAHDQRMNNQQYAFEKRFSENEELARETYADQGLVLGRELINQKQKFLRASEKYSGGKDKDPFYQIRDNGTKFYETSGAYVLEAKVPEHEKDNVYVRVKKDRVTLSGNRSFDDEIKSGGKLIRTNNVQTFQEQYDIPKKVKETEIMRDYKDGVLKVVIPKVV